MGEWQVIHGSMLDVLPALRGGFRRRFGLFDACVCDPPYELGFMGRDWDASGIAFRAETWRHVYRVLKPGTHLVAFGGTRTWHRIAVAIEDAGFEIRDNLAWLYGQGFPKSLDLSKAIDKAAGAERPVVGSRVLTGSAAMSTAEKGGTYASNTDSRGRTKEVSVTAPATELARQWQGWGTALKPSFEPIILARKPLAGTVAQNVERFGVGGLNIDACRTPAEAGGRPLRLQAEPSTRGGFLAGVSGSRAAGEQANLEGRWPPNVCVDEAVACDLDATYGTHKAGKSVTRNGGGGKIFNAEKTGGPRPDGGYSDSGGVSRYFYCPKANGKERDAGLDHWPVLSGGEATGREDDSAGVRNPGAGAGRCGGRRNPHPTVKPWELLRWLLRLVTPPGGFVLDPFAGSGSCGIAAVLEGFRYLGIELNDTDAEPFVSLARDRIIHAERCAQKPSRQLALFAEAG